MNTAKFDVPKPIKIVLLFGLLLLGWALFSPGPASAQGLAQETAPNVSADEVNAVARKLWCPLCSGVRLDTCELKACDQMREVIALKLAAGETPAEIRAYFLEQYGPQVLGEPPREGFNWLAWILPVVVVAGGGVFFWTRLQRMSRRPAPADVTPAPTAPAQTAHEQQLEKELARYD